MNPYRNPLRDAKVTAGRVDQGVDYTGSGAIYALGPGVIEETQNSGWPGGAMIVERLTGGPLAGRWVYAAEDINPQVRVGQHVTASTVLGQITGGIELGMAAPPPNLGQALAYVTGQSNYHGDPGAHPTAWGEFYNRLLTSLGAPPGLLSGTPKGSTGGASSASAGSPASSASPGLAGLAIIIPLAAAGAALAIWGAARATGTTRTLRRAGTAAAIGAAL